MLGPGLLKSDMIFGVTTIEKFFWLASETILNGAALLPESPLAPASETVKIYCPLVASVPTVQLYEPLFGTLFAIVMGAGVGI